MQYNDAINKWYKLNNYTDFQFDDLEEEEKYCPVFTTSNQISNGLSFEFNYYQNDNHRLLPAFLSHILSTLTGFKTIYEHAKFIESNRLADFNLALFCLKELWDIGLLMSQTYFIKELSKKKSKVSVPVINTVGWITRNRSDSLKRSIESFIQSLKVKKYKLDFIVFDDSTQNNYYINKQNIDKLSKKHQTKIRLVGKTERKIFLEKLILKLKNKVPKRVVEYGLLGIKNIKEKCGANRNTFVLYTKGKFAISTDDDIFCQIAKNGNDRKLSIISDDSGLSSEFFKDQSELTEYLQYDHNDLISLHQKLLGSSINNLIPQYDGQLDLSAIDPKFVHDYLTKDKKVRITMMGVAGDSGAGSPISKIFMQKDNLIHLISDSTNFLSKLYSRTVLQTYKTLTVEPPKFLLGMNLGIDNTELLPPFCPNFRNQDGIFAATLRKCFTDSYIGHLPFAISHIPPSVRLVDSSNLTSTTIRVPDALLFSINEFTNTASTKEGGLKALGNYIREISEKSQDTFHQYFEFINAKFKTDTISSLEQLLKQHNQINRKWVELTELRIETLNKYLQSGDISAQFKEFSHLSQNDQLLSMRKIYRNFGELLFYWPEIYNCVYSDPC